MSAGGHCHGDPTLPWQPTSCSGLLSPGTLLVQTGPIRFDETVFPDVHTAVSTRRALTKALKPQGQFPLFRIQIVFHLQHEEWPQQKNGSFCLLVFEVSFRTEIAVM